MNESRVISRGIPLKGQVLGYSGDCGLYIARLKVEGDAVNGCEFLEFHSPHLAMASLVEGPEPLGIGMDAILAVGTGSQGWRPADYWMHEGPFHYEDKYGQDKYGNFPFHWGPFHIPGYGTLGAIALLGALRRRWPDLRATETEPTETYTHLARSKAWPELPERMAALARWLNTDLPASQSECDEARWRAAMSAYSMWMGLRGAWPINLHALTRDARPACVWTFGEGASTEESFQEPALNEKTLIFPAGPAFFFWPPDERAGA